jgi:hypothetical protein
MPILKGLAESFAEAVSDFFQPRTVVLPAPVSDLDGAHDRSELRRLEP